jgi:hypothetical protein
MSEQSHVQLVGVLHIVRSALLLLLGLFVMGLLSSIGLFSEDETAFMILSIVGTFVGGLLFVIALPGLIGGIGLLKHQEWARITIIIVSILSLVDIPLGTALGAYSLWVLMRDEAGPIFRPAAAVPAAPPATAPAA